MKKEIQIYNTQILNTNSTITRILVLGGDSRSFYLAKELEKQLPSVKIYAYGNSVDMIAPELNVLEEDWLLSLLEKCQIIILPVPYTVDGIFVKWGDKNSFPISIAKLQETLHEGQIVFGSNLKPDFVRQLREKKIKHYDFITIPGFAEKNAVATAEGTVAEAIMLLKTNLEESNCLVLGYGICGKEIAKKLQMLSAKVSVMARRKEIRKECEQQGYMSLSMFEDLINKNSNLENPPFEKTEQEDTLLKEYDLVINTIPDRILSGKAIDMLKQDVVIIDIASNPGGTDFDYCKEHGISAKLCLGLPGKYAPESSGKILADLVIQNINKNKM